MILTNKQEQGLNIAINNFKNRIKYTVISGFAGSGKSTLVKYIVQSLPKVDPENDVCYACYTGKAAQVLLKKGNKNVSTLHRLLYDSFPKPDGTFYRRPVPSIPYKVVIVDEVSMVPQDMIKLLLSYRIYVVFLGDPFQLPPVDKNGANDLLAKPDIFLDEIMRQAQESEIIRVSMDIRSGKPISVLNGNEVKVFQKQDFSESMLTWADQILVGTNETRVALNNNMRQLLGRNEQPEEGDKVICLRNYWDMVAENGDPLVNGTIGILKNPYSTFVKIPYYMGGNKFDILVSDFISDGGAKFSELRMDKKEILTGERCCDWKLEYRLSNNASTRSMVPLQFEYGYAITVHKAQGSSWEKVLIVEERFPFDKTEHARWLYTAITRAEQKAVIISK